MKHALYISPIFSLGIVAPLRHVLTRGNCQLNYGQKHLKCPSEHRTPNDLIRRNRSLQRFRVDSFSASDGCCQGMADPVPIVRTFMSSPEVTCSWTCLKAFKFGCSLEICCKTEPGQNCDLMRRGILVSKKMQQKSQLHQNQLVRSSQ